MKKFFWGIAILVGLQLSGCATSIGAYEQRTVSENEAIVLVGVDSEVPFSSARYCNFLCLNEYILGGRKDIHAIPVSVDSTFILNTLHTMDNRVARLKKVDELKIEKPGIYYYGTIVGSQSRAGIKTGPSPQLLAAAKRKYGNRFDKLQPQNFSWEASTEDNNLGIGYQESPVTQNALRSHAGLKLHLAKVAPPSSFDAGCRLGGIPLSLPHYLPYEDYIKRAFNQELKTAQIFDDTSSSLNLKGSITELAFSTTGDSSWKMGLRIESLDGRSAKANVTVPFNAPWMAVTACTSAEDAVPNAVQKLIEALVSSPEFQAILSGKTTQVSTR